MSLSGNTEKINELISKINALPEAGSGGGSGGGVETCSIRLVCTTRDIYGYTYLAYRDGAFVPVSTFSSVPATGVVEGTLDVTLDDVVCNGFIYVQTSIVFGFLVVSITGEATYAPISHVSSVKSALNIYAPATSGSESTVTIIDDN